MADSEAKPKETHTMNKKKKNKRKLSSLEEGAERPTKTHRVEQFDKHCEQIEVEQLAEELGQRELEEESPWRNLRLILSIQNKQLELHKKVELAFHFVKMRVTEEGNSADQDYETVKLSRLIVFLNDWVQSLLIPSEKKLKGVVQKPEGEVIETWLDSRCWEIFKFCLEESLRLQVSLNFSRNLLRSIFVIAKNAVSLVNNTLLSSQELYFIGEGFKLHSIVLDCISLVFSSHGGLSNENLDLWMSTVDAVLELVHKVYIKNLDSGNMGVFAMRFSCLVLEPFAMFLRVHPTRKTGFHDFIDKLLEPLMHLLSVLHLQSGGSNSHWTENLLKLVEEVLFNGLFHPIHIDGFLSLCGTEKYATTIDGESKNSKTVIKSYHRHFFDKLERTLTEKKVLAMGGIGELFRLLVHRVKKLKGVSVLSADTKMIGKGGASRNLEDNSLGHTSKLYSGSSNVHLDKSYSSSGFNADTRKSLFDFFVQIMEPLLLNINAYLQAKPEVRPELLEVHGTLKSINNLLASFMDEKVYLRTEDNSEGACFNFLKKVYDTVISFSTNLLWLSKYDLENQKHIGTLTFLANEVFVAVGYLLEIEYEIIGNDLVSLWLMMFSYSTIGLSLVDVLDQSSLSSKIEAFGCQLINLYSQLRQVNNTIFALCKAVRLVISHDDGGEINYTRFMAALPSEAYAKSVGNLLSSQDFKFAVCNAIKSIPEGQASGCIRQLTEDISESLEWMKVNCSVAEGNEIGNLEVSSLKCFDQQAELLGRGLSELYTLVLDSVTVTIGNSNLLGVSVKDLMTLLCPCMNSLVGVQPLTVNKFLCSVTGRNFDAGNKDDLLKFGFSSYWVFVFFFRLYMFCRSLYRQAISLMPPDLSRRILEVMGDSSTAYTGKDWMERTDWGDGGYFSWIHQPSTSLLVVIQSVSNIYLQDSSEDCCPLIYVLNAMALQRLVDLNRQINSLEYLLQSNDNLVQKMLLDDASLSLYRKRSRKWARCISVLRQEVAGLTDYMMGHLRLVAEGQQSISSDDATCVDTSAQALLETEEWDFSICSMNKKSLPTAIWWILCQNIDIWCSHTAKKKLKLFLSLLIHTFIPSSTSSFVRIGKQHINEPSQLKKVTMHQISSELLSDSILYEQKFVRRYLASRFCRVLEKSVLPLFKDFSSGNVELKSSPHWPEVLGALEKSSVKVSGSELVTCDCFSDSKSIAHSSEKLRTEICTEQKALPFTGFNFTSCHSLLNLLCWMPKGYLTSRSFSVYATYILNLERVVVGSLLECQGTLYSHRHHDLFRLFVSCRKALKYIIMAACEKKTEASQSSFAPILPEDSFSALWLFKSVSLVGELQQAVSKDIASQVKDLIFSLMDHTSYVFLTLSKYQISHAVHFFLNAKRPCKEQPFSGNVNEQCNLIESNPCLDSSNCIEAWNDAFLVVKMLKEQAQSLVNYLKDNLCTEKEFLGVDVVNLNKFSSIVSCFSGFLWGLASAINDDDARFHDNKAKSLGWTREHVSELNLCISVFEDFINLFLRMFLVEVDQQPRSYCDALNLKKSEYGPDFLDAEERPLNGSAQAESSSGRQQQKSGAAMACSLSSVIDDNSRKASVRRFQLKDASFAASIMTKVDSFDLQVINKPLLQCLLKGDYPEVAFSLRQLLIASSAILRIKLQINKISSLSSLVPCLAGISQVLLLELVGMVDIPDTFSFVWLDGVLKYLEELGNHFPSDNPTLYGNVYARMIELHLRAMGKCITLQGKRATLASHETESSTKTLHGHIGFSEASHLGPHCLDEFKARLRISFKMFIKKPSRLHLLTVIQTIEKALVGVREGCMSIYDITTGNVAGGKISSIVAAGIDCFDLVIEFVSGRKRLDVVKEHIQSILAGLFNIILHLQNPLIFQRFMHDKGNTNPDSGSVILMCIEVLIRIFGKHALFQMKPWHVAQSLRIPAALFQDFHQIKLSQASISSHSSLILDNEISDRLASKDLSVVDRHFSIDLFAACCRLLYTVLKHHKSECERCISLLEASVSVLLHCLETVDTDSIVRKGYFSWELEEGVKCGCFLRRIYEEIRQQKESVGRHCSQFLANYIYVYSGYGPLKTGIKREIDEALRPGIYALIDACSADDLQYLHTVFGEGPCRNTLATLRHDYKLNFQYEGKV